MCSYGGGGRKWINFQHYFLFNLRLLLTKVGSRPWLFGSWVNPGVYTRRLSDVETFQILRRLALILVKNMTVYCKERMTILDSQALRKNNNADVPLEIDVQFCGLGIMLCQKAKTKMDFLKLSKKLNIVLYKRGLSAPKRGRDKETRISFTKQTPLNLEQCTYDT